MKTIALHLGKGGTGKTSLSGALGYELARRGKTCLVDVDPQGNLTSWHLAELPEAELTDALTGKLDVKDAIRPTGTPDLDILPTRGLDGDLRLYAESQLEREPFVFCDLTEELARLGYAFAVLDLSPAFGRLERAALIAADEVLCPMSPEYFGIDGIELFNGELGRLKKSMRRGPDFRRIIINAYDARIEQHRKIAGDVETWNAYTVFRVPTDPSFRKAQARHVSIQALPPDLAAKAETIETLHRVAEAV
jgi:chromosome partitioning protein